MKNCLTFIASALFLLPQWSFGQTTPSTESDSLRVAKEEQRKKVRAACISEFDSIVHHIEHTYVSGRRGLSDEVWNRRNAVSRHKLEQFLNTYNGYYIYTWRYLGSLTQDTHFAFPDDGMFNRVGVFKKEDPIFPLWVQTRKDGSVYNVKDYSGVLPPHAQIMSVNGHSARRAALQNRIMAPGEDAIAMATMNAHWEADPRSWPNFANYLFMEGITPPFKVVYTISGSERPDTVTLAGIPRETKYKLYKKSGDKRRVKAEWGFARKPIVYTRIQDSIGILSINSFWGKRWSPMLLFGKDWRYNRLLKQSMRRIDRHNIKKLVIDISRNPGGMAENIYRTLGYFTDKPIDIRQIYLITDNNRKLAQTNILRSPQLPEADRNALAAHIDTIPSGTQFCTDTVRPLQYTPDNSKHRFKGNVYILTGPNTYSAAQIFARYCRKLGIGPVAGAPCGGYNDVTGNAVQVPLPFMSRARFQVPFSAVRVCESDNPYDYPSVDIPIEQPFEEWLNRKDHSLERLLEIIQ